MEKPVSKGLLSGMSEMKSARGTAKRLKRKARLTIARERVREVLNDCLKLDLNRLGRAGFARTGAVSVRTVSWSELPGFAGTVIWADLTRPPYGLIRVTRDRAEMRSSSLHGFDPM
jgi:hypothetical protein